MPMSTRSHQLASEDQQRGVGDRAHPKRTDPTGLSLETRFSTSQISCDGMTVTAGTRRTRNQKTSSRKATTAKSTDHGPSLPKSRTKATFGAGTLAESHIPSEETKSKKRRLHKFPYHLSRLVLFDGTTLPEEVKTTHLWYSRQRRLYFTRVKNPDPCYEWLDESKTLPIVILAEMLGSKDWEKTSDMLWVQKKNMTAQWVKNSNQEIRWRKSLLVEFLVDKKIHPASGLASCKVCSEDSQLSSWTLGSWAPDNETNAAWHRKLAEKLRVHDENSQVGPERSHPDEILEAEAIQPTPDDQVPAAANFMEGWNLISRQDYPAKGLA